LALIETFQKTLSGSTDTPVYRLRVNRYTGVLVVLVEYLFSLICAAFVLLQLSYSVGSILWLIAQHSTFVTRSNESRIAQARQ